MEREWDPWWMEVIVETANNFALSLICPGTHKRWKTRMHKLLETEFSLFLSLDLECCAAMASFLWHRNHCRWDIIFSTPD